MKRKFYHPEPTAAESKGPAYWRSLDDLQGSQHFQDWVHREFPDGADTMNEVDRRNFMKIMAASFGFAGAGMTGCRMPERSVFPYAKQPEYLIPGVANYYSTSMPFGSENIPLVVETHQARPTKIEGNPSYKPHGGGTNTFTQVSILDLYDPDRARTSRDSAGKKLTRSQVEDQLKAIAEQYADSTGEGLAFLAESSSSDTRSRLVQQLKTKFPQAIWAEHDAIDQTNASKAASALLGSPVRVLHRLEKAKRILTLDSDFVGYEPDGTGTARSFANGRRIKSAKEASKMSRLYTVESNLSLSGANADHRLRVESLNIPAFTALVASHIVPSLKGKVPSGFSPEQEKWAKECAADLLANKGKSIVLAGSHLSVEVHKLVVAINEALNARGRTLDYVSLPENTATSIQDLATALNTKKVKTLFVLGGNPAYDAPAGVDWAAAQANAENVYRLGYSEDETSSPEGAKPNLILQSHYLESWGDGRAWDGTYVPVQPMLESLFGGMTEIELIARVSGEETTNPNDLVKQTFAQVSGKSGIRHFNKWLAEGILASSQFRVNSLDFDEAKLNSVAANFKVHSLSRDRLEARFVPSAHNWDGRYANNGWAQECPHPITKITWDNAILISAKLGAELGIIPDPWSMSDKVLGQEVNQLVRKTNDFNRGREMAPIARITIDGVSVEGPLHVQPGIADYTLVLPLGHGRSKVGRIGEGSGFNFYPARQTASSESIGKVVIEVTDKNYKLANTQEHWSQEGRAIVREGTAEEYSKDPNFTNKIGIESHSPNLYPKIKDTETGKWREMTEQEKARYVPRGNSAYTPPNFTEIEKKSDRLKLLVPGRYSPDGLFDDDKENNEESQTYVQQWGMVIDFNTCLGCNSCVVACQSENNIPIVGKDQVLRGREMHWIRIDRYFSNDAYKEGGKHGVKPDKLAIPDDVQVSFQSVACQQCELAPCESVCPVNATVHDEQGINTMAYNRCIGTRYCANNCPYKVRRFNFLDWNKREIGHFYEGPLGPSGMNELEQMQKNPDVSIRMRGVMEKCTYCVQRIQEAKINHKSKNAGSGEVYVPDGTIKTACQQVCPTDAITFGDILDEDSEVAKLKDNDRNYAVLGYLNIRPRTTYLTKVRNPNPKMPKAYSMPYARKEYETRYGHGLPHDDVHTEVGHH